MLAARAARCGSRWAAWQLGRTSCARAGTRSGAVQASSIHKKAEVAEPERGANGAGFAHPDAPLLSSAVSNYWEHVRNYFMHGGDIVEDRDSKVQSFNESTMRQFIQTALRVKKAPSSDVMPDVVTRRLCESYVLLDKEGKLKFFDLLASEFGVHEREVESAIAGLSSAKSKGPRAAAKAMERLHGVTRPVYQSLFQQITQTMGGMRFLVGMRADLLGAIRSQESSASQFQLRAMDGVLLRMLVDWFNVGFLDLQRISWNSPASYLEQVIKGEAVHVIRDWRDLKRRLSDDRRVFAFFHKSMPHTPLNVVHVALTDSLSDNIQELLREREQPFRTDAVNTAIFYSISSTQPGLTGADLGNFLIKRVVGELQQTFPKLDTFSTLSPIPGFRPWLEGKLQRSSSTDPPLLSDAQANALAQAAPGTPDGIAALKTLLSNDAWASDPSLCDVLRPTLMHLCARYLVREKKRKFALDPVANFHIRNGACVYRINWMGDTSAKGMQRSYGMMVNYKYDLEDVEVNNERYLLDAHIATGPSVDQLLAQA